MVDGKEKMRYNTVVESDHKPAPKEEEVSNEGNEA